MPIFDFECPTHGVYNDLVYSWASDSKCPTCGTPGMKLVSGFVGHKMPAETTSPKYQAWFNSKKTQAKLRSGEYRIAGRSDDLNHA